MARSELVGTTLLRGQMDAWVRLIEWLDAVASLERAAARQIATVLVEARDAMGERDFRVMVVDFMNLDWRQVEGYMALLEDE